MANFITGGIILIILISAILYIVKAKKKGAHCIGCPASGSCGKHGCTCGEKEDEQDK